jgi:hypothetical protein
MMGQATEFAKVKLTPKRHSHLLAVNFHEFSMINQNGDRTKSGKDLLIS